MRYNEQFIVETLHLIGVIFFFYVSYRGQKALQINIYIYIYILQKSLWLFAYGKKNIIIQSVQISFAYREPTYVTKT